MEIPNHVAYWEIPDFIKGKKKSLSGHGHLEVREPMALDKTHKRFKKDSRSSARRGKSSPAPAPTKGKKK